MNSTYTHNPGMAELSACMIASFMSSIEVTPSEETQAFDRAWALASAGQVETALDGLLSSIYSRYDDGALFGQSWVVIPLESDTGKLLNSIGLLYSCRYAEAEDLLCTLSEKTFRSQAVLARCMEKMSCRNAVERIYSEMYERYLADGTPDTPMYRNFLYRYAIDGLHGTGQAAAVIMRYLFMLEPDNNTLLSALRGLLTSGMAPDMPPDETIYRFYDLAVSDEEFLECAGKIRGENPPEWEGFTSFVAGLEL
jgi:hypothetical protein